MLSPFTFRKGCLLLALALVITATATARFTHRSYAASSKRQPLTFEDRVAAQRAIEAVYHRHRLWPTDNPQPKPALDEVLPEAELRAKVVDYLQMSRALELFAGAPLAPTALQQELERMAGHSRMPVMLDELWAALGRDPLLAAECLARPVVAERELRQWFEEREAKSVERGTGDASALRDPQASILHPHSFDEWWSGARGGVGVELDAPGWAYRLPEVVAAPCGGDMWTAASTTGAPNARDSHTAVWTGSEMIVWGGLVGNTYLNTGGRYNPTTDSWASVNTTSAPNMRVNHTAVWTGSEMIVWGGFEPSCLQCVTNTGGRYNPLTNVWTATDPSSAPSARGSHTAVWTGSEMIVWGGVGPDGTTSFNTGGRYNPTNNNWAVTSVSGTPSGLSRHTAVWTGRVMIVWGGNSTGSPTNVGGRYDPATNTWAATSTNGAPSVRWFHTAVWTGNEMIIWGGGDGGSPPGFLDTGARYNPVTNAWTATSATNAPSSRSGHTTVWTGTEMIIWGGWNSSTNFNTGGRYDPATDSWKATSTTSTPSARDSHTAVWTGSEMIIWGGLDNSSDPLNTASRYSFALSISPTTQSFNATGGTGSVAVTAQGGCTWTATSNASFITITAGGSSTGNGTVNFTVAPNTSQNSRMGTLTIGAQTFTVTQSGENPVPALAGLSPGSAVAGGAAFTLTVNGAGFASGATARWNGANRPTTVVSATQLTAQIPASDLLVLGPAAVTVFNPTPGGGASNALSLNVTASVSSTSAASFSGAELAADSIVAAFGNELATQTLAAPVLPLPTTLAGTTVRVRDSAGAELLAPLFYVSPSQVNYLMPAGGAAGRVTVTITSGNGKVSLGAAEVVAVAAGLFAANANGQGVAAAVALRVSSGTQTFEPTSRFDTVTGRFVPVPIDLGPEGDQIILLLFGTGIRGRSALSAVTCTIDGVAVPVSFAAAAPGFVGLDQVNAGPLPRILAGRSEVDLVLTVDGKVANTVRIAIK